MLLDTLLLIPMTFIVDSYYYSTASNTQSSAKTFWFIHSFSSIEFHKRKFSIVLISVRTVNWFRNTAKYAIQFFIRFEHWTLDSSVLRWVPVFIRMLSSHEIGLVEYSTRVGYFRVFQMNGNILVFSS